MKAIPLVAFTANAPIADCDRALEAGFDEYALKPVEMPRLLKKIEAFLKIETTS